MAKKPLDGWHAQADEAAAFRLHLLSAIGLIEAAFSNHPPVMNKTAKSKKSSAKKSSAKVKDLKPKKNPKGGLQGLLLPAVQKVRQP